MNLKTDKIYPDSGVELSPFSAKNYDKVMNIASLGLYCVALFTKQLRQWIFSVEIKFSI